MEGKSIETENIRGKGEMKNGCLTGMGFWESDENILELNRGDSYNTVCVLKCHRDAHFKCLVLRYATFTLIKKQKINEHRIQDYS